LRLFARMRLRFARWVLFHDGCFALFTHRPETIRMGGWGQDAFFKLA
jgi:hypothetical protein